MKLPLFSIALFFLVLACDSAPSESSVASLESEAVAQNGGTISVAAFEQKLKTPGIQILDVRTAGEFQGGHFNNSLQANWLDENEFAERVQHIDKSRPVLVYCASGVRSAEAMNWMKQNGFADVSNLRGGISAWRMEGKPLASKAAREEMSMAAFTASTKTGTVLVDIGAEWCPPCVKMEPVLQQLQKEKGTQFGLVRVDGGIDIEVMKLLRSEGLPTFILFKNGKETWRKQGIVDYATLASAIQ